MREQAGYTPTDPKGSIRTVPADLHARQEQCLLRSIRNVSAATAARFESLPSQIRRHRAVTRTTVVALAMAVVLGLSQQAVSQASPPLAATTAPTSLLPTNVGVAIPTNDAIRITFPAPMSPPSVDAGLRLLPETSFTTSWSRDLRSVEITPSHLWATDQRYLVFVPEAASKADGAALGQAARYSFTTQTAPTVSDFLVDVDDPAAEAAASQPMAMLESGVTADPDAVEPNPVPPNTAGEVSRRTSITIGFATRMNASDVEEQFAITPGVKGSFAWRGNQLTFTPEKPFAADSRYSVSVAGARDALGNPIGGEAVFSFTTRVGAQVVRAQPALDAADVTGNVLELWFSAPMQTDAVDTAFAIRDLAAGGLVGGNLSWNADGTHLTFIGDSDFPASRRFELRLNAGSVDGDGNPVEMAYTFSSAAGAAADVSVTQRDAVPPSTVTPTQPPTTPTPVVPPPAPSSDAVQYALNQVNAARAAYGFAPIVLDAAVSAVAQAHATDQAVNGYFSHVSLDGRTRDQRLAAGGVSYSSSGENQCYYSGLSIVQTLTWCHAQFMSEPYPGQWNHIANILGPSFTRLGVGIAQAGSTVIITWDFVG